MSSALDRVLVGGARQVNLLLGRLGFRIMYWPKPLDEDQLRMVGKTGDLVHTRLEPLASFSPWLTDAAFVETHGLVARHTLVDHYRCWELWSLVDQLRSLSGDLIEIGVWRGGSGVLMAKRCQLSGIEATVFLCDTFTGVPKAGDGDTNYTGGEHADTSQEVVLTLAQRVGVANVRILKGLFPDETGAEIQHRKFRFCHIDVDVYRSAKETFDWIWPRLVAGGVVVFDDYGFKGCEGVTRLVEELGRGPDRLTLYNLNGHALVIKR